MIIEKIPLLDLQPEIKEIRGEIMAAIENIIDSGQFIMGPDVKEFEKETAEYLGVKHAIGVNSGTDALVLGVRALGLQAGDEVITTPFTFFATGECISHVGATPVFVDIDPRTFNLDVAQIEKAITPKTRMIIPVHLYGHAVDMDPLIEVARKYGLTILEDTAQAWGSEYKGKKAGAIADAGAYSFFPSKNLGGFGDGGLFVTNDDELADTVRMLRVHGARKKYHNETVGVNSRLDTIQAAVLRIKLRKIDEWNEGRRRAAARYNEMLAGIEGVLTPVEAGYTKHVYHQYTIRIDGGRRDKVQAHLGESNVGSFVYYPVPVDKLPVYKDLPAANCPISDLCTTEALSLPIWPSITEDVQARVVELIKQAL
ncbi:MAG: DegT/DnrJ/EryC1/StrS family aminotransferase [Armatimonadetes bacterium]|nr:DegT/DnrJ/EryC1/StrS family aminotransferase [Armatimonadota bacterium]